MDRSLDDTHADKEGVLDYVLRWLDNEGRDWQQGRSHLSIRGTL